MVCRQERGSKGKKGQGMVIFVTGGARSGKSSFALKLAEKLEGKRLFLATAEALDEEIGQRIQRHRKQRGNRWDTLEEPIYLGRALRPVLGLFRLQGLAVFLSIVLFMLLFGLFFQKRLGGVTGDILGAACEINEVVTLLAVGVISSPSP